MDFKKLFKTSYDEKFLKKPIFIFGSPRTGTTLTYVIMCAHPDLAWFSVNDIHRWISYPIITKIKSSLTSMPLKGDLRLLLKGPDKPGANRSRLPPDLQPIEGNSFWNKIFKEWPKQDIPENSKKEIKKVISNTVKRQKKLRFLNKAPLHSTRLFVLKNIFPDAKFINVIREPCATLASMLTRHERDGEFIANSWPIINKPKYEKLDLIQKHAWIYAEVVDATYEFLEKNSKIFFMTILYEEFIKNPIGILPKMLEFCELKIPASLENMVPPIYDSAHKWKERFSNAEQKKIYDIVQPSLQKMNYPYQI